MMLASWTRLVLELVIGVALVVTVSLVVVAVAFDHDDPPSETPAVARAADPRNALCEAAVAARPWPRPEGTILAHVFRGARVDSIEHRPGRGPHVACGLG